VDTPSGISTASLHGVAWLTVEGRGSFENSPELRALVHSGIDGGASRMVLDLQRCSGMDSTFMGMLSCVAVKLEDAGGCLHVVNAAGKNGELLRGLGLDEVFTVEDGTALMEREGCVCEAELAAVPKVPCTKDDHREICLEAHEALAEVKPENLEKFQEVISLMRQKARPAGVAH
jgi:anti-anti-sigma regulatory factor